jgi:hypothetical protein
MTRFAILACGHWVTDPLDVTRIGQPAPCPFEPGDATVIARPVDPDATFVTDVIEQDQLP